MITQRQRGVLVGVDGTLPSDEACRYGCREAADLGISLVLLHAWTPSSIYHDGTTQDPPTWANEAEVRAAAGLVLERAAALVVECAPGIKHEERLVEDQSSHALVEATRHAQLLVVGGRERRRHDLSWMGSVPLHVVPRAHCPVLVVPTDPRTEGAVVVGIDGSSLSGAVAGFAFEQAARRRSALVAVLAFSPAFGGLAPDSHQESDLREDARRALVRVLAPWREKHPDVVVNQVLSTEHPARAVRTAADDAGLLVLGSHGRGVVWRHALGSVSSALLRVATCPVAVLGPEACL